MDYKPYKPNYDDLKWDLIVLSILGWITSALAIWSVVEFILYLLKDDPFNWTSVILFGVGMLLQMIFVIRRILNEDI